jgi:hypothetical protein
MEGRQDDKGSGYEFNGTRKSPEQLPVVVQHHRMHVSFRTNLLGNCGSSVAVRTRIRASFDSIAKIFKKQCNPYTGLDRP